MKAAALAAVALILSVALPGSIQAKQKSTFCVGKDGKNYAVGDSYVDNEGEACIRYKCAKRKGKFIMKKEKCDCNGGNHGISCCPNYVRGDMVGGSEIKITFSPNTENGCQNSCKIQHPTSIGVTQHHDGTSSCYCEFGSPIVGGSANVYKTCLFSTATPGMSKRIKTIAVATTITTATTITSTTSTSTMTTTTTKSVYFIAIGDSIELYHPTIENLKCAITPPSLKSLNRRWNGHTSFYHSNSIYLCGGNKKEASICISYNNKINEWRTHALSISRYYGHTSVVLKNTLYLIGGADTNRVIVDSVSAPLPLTNQSIFTPIPNLDFKRTYPCTAKIDEDTFVITGGSNGHFHFETVTQYSTKTGTATSLPSLATGRNNHGCVLAEINNKKWLIVSGGVNYRLAKGKQYLQSTEMLEFWEGAWTSLGNLNIPRFGFSMIATERGVMAIAGADYVHGKMYLKSVELLDWTSKKWKVVQPSIHLAIYDFGGAVEIPASLFNCPEIIDGTCYEDDRSRLLDDMHTSATNTPDECIGTCASRGYYYAGVQNTNQCFCGNDDPPASRIRDSSQCNQKCTGDASFNCGGYWRMNIYNTVKTGSVNGEWSAWSKFSACSATCGDATKIRSRTCSNPSPSNGGKPCTGLDKEVVSCDLSTCGFNMSATCDDVMWLFADGDLLVNNSSDWRVTSEVHIPACTKVIEIHCLDSWIHGGILASSDNGLITDGAWNCSSDNRTTWNPAYLLGRNGRTAPDISPEAIWIWTDMSHWMQTDHRRHTKAICKIELETSQCPEPPICPPFSELTPTTISTPTPAPTTTTTIPKPGFNLTATCDNEMKLFVDGNLLATSSNWRDTSRVNIPANTEAIEIHCMDTGTVGGILASSDNGLLTDGTWNCSSDNGTTWNPAHEVGPNSGAVPDISPEAEWIWTGCIGDWTSKYTGKKHKKNIICKIDLEPVIDGGWSEWSPYSPCSASCGDATKARTRTCSNPLPENGGEPCHGLEKEVVSCGVDPCGGDSCPYIDKYMDCSKWKNHCESGQWEHCMKENCPKTCNCTVDMCTGNFYENGRPPAGTKCVEKDNKMCYIESGRWGKSWCYTEVGSWGAECVRCSDPINGNWGPWSSCSKSCIGGKRTRTCTNPVPKNGGKPCTGESIEDCNNDIECGISVSARSARSSSVWGKNFGPLLAIDGITSNTSTFFHSQSEDSPWLEIELLNPANVSRVTIFNRDSLGYRFRNVEIRAGMTRVPDGKRGLLDINNLCRTYYGPAMSKEVINIECMTPIMAKYITIQLKDRDILNLNEVKVNHYESGSVKLVSGYPYILSGSTWMPICGHSFWDNNIGASIFCKKLGFAQGGSIIVEEKSYNDDAYYVGLCEAGDVRDLENGCTKHQTASCNKGERVSFKVKCNGIFNYARSSSAWSYLYGPERAIDGDSSTLFHSGNDNKPWLEIELCELTQIDDVRIFNRGGNLAERFKNAEITIRTDTENTEVICGTYEGPATKEEVIIDIICDKPIMAKYLKIQLKHTGILNLMEVEINQQGTTSITTTTVLVMGPEPWTVLNVADFSQLSPNSTIQDPGITRNDAYGSVSKVINGTLYLCDSKACRSHNGLEWKIEEGMNLVEKRSFPADALILNPQLKWIVHGDFIPTVDVFTPQSGKWIKDTNYKSPYPVDLGCIVIIEGKILQVGGRGRKRIDGSYYTKRVFFDDVEVASLKENRIYHHCTIFENRVWVAGGVVRGEHSVNLHKDVEIYDYKTDTWTAGPSFPDEIADRVPKLKVIQGDLYYIGSYSGKIFKLSNGVWKKVADNIPTNNKFIAEVVEISL